MAIAGTITVQTTDFGNALNHIVDACTINALKVNAVLTGGTDTGAYCELTITANSKDYVFRLINSTFNGTSGLFYIDLSDILQYFFDDVSDDILTSGVSDVNDTFMNILIELKLYKSNGTALDSKTYEYTNLIFAAKQLGCGSSSEIDGIEVNNMPLFLAQKNLLSYIYYFGTGTMTFEKINSIPEQYAMLDNNEFLMLDNDGNAMINEF